MSLSVADTKQVLTKSIASDSESGVTASCSNIRFSLGDIQNEAKSYFPYYCCQNDTFAGNNRGLGDFNWLSKNGVIRVEPEP